jgi:hypothetical protein
MLIKDGEYHSQWQTVGDLKAQEPKVISLPACKKSTIRKSLNVTIPIVAPTSSLQYPKLNIAHYMPTSDKNI